MTDQPTIRIERTMNAPAEQVYKAFLDPATMAQYQVPEGSEAIFGAFHAEVGAENSYEFTGPQGGMKFLIKFLELNEFTLIRHTYQIAMPPPMDDMMEVQIHFAEQDGKTTVRFEQYGLPTPIPVEGATAGWTGMMDRLVTLMES